MGLRMEQVDKELKEFLDDSHCHRSFICCTEGLEHISKVKDIGMKDHLQCLEEDASLCPASASFGSINFCHCPLRVYILKKLGK